MKILQVTNFFKPSWEAGGPVRSVYETSKSLVKNGHDVTVYTTDGFKSRLDVEKNKPVNVDGVKTYYFRNLSLFVTKNMNFPIPYYAPLVLRKEIQNFDIIHINEHRTVLAILIHHYAKKNKIPYVLQPRGTIPTMGKSKQKKRFDQLFGYSIIKDASKIIASSKIESDQYFDLLPDLDSEKIVHIPNGIDLVTYQNLPEKGTFKKKYSINSDEKVVLFLSRLHKRKGADLLIKAFCDLKCEFKNVKLVIVGPDEGYLDKLKSIVAELNIMDDVVFTGPLYESDKIEAYVDADVFVLPSKDRYESFGNVVLEAMACGMPVIVTNNCGVSEWIGPNAGYIIEYDKDKLKDAILILFDDDAKRINIGAIGKIQVSKEFGWNQIIEKNEIIYSDVLQQKSSLVKYMHT